MVGAGLAPALQGDPPEIGGRIVCLDGACIVL